MNIIMVVEIPDERTVAEARDIAQRFHEEYDDVHIKSAILMNIDDQPLLDLMTLEINNR